MILRLIKAYIKRKKRIEGDKMSMVDVNEILPTNDAEMNKIRRRALEEKIANLQKEPSLKVENLTRLPLHLAAAAGGNSLLMRTRSCFPDGSIAFGGKGIGKGKSTTRRCASCGAFGHIRTNKACPFVCAYLRVVPVQIPPGTERYFTCSNQEREKKPLVRKQRHPLMWELRFCLRIRKVCLLLHRLKYPSLKRNEVSKILYCLMHEQKMYCNEMRKHR